jgi:hypothetical protein
MLFEEADRFAPAILSSLMCHAPGADRDAAAAAVHGDRNGNA